MSAFPSPLPSIAAASPGGKDAGDFAEAIFNEVMAAYSGLVFSTALRKLCGDAESAREVTQNVFLMAFRKREMLATLACPAAWFHRAAMLESNNFLRVESRRRKYLEAWAAEQSGVNDEASAGLSEVLRAQLDEALHGLRDTDRELILSRFFEGRSFQELAEHRGSTPDAVRMKLTRILEKLSSVLQRRGVTVTIAALASGLGAQWSHAAPAGLGAAVAAAATTGTAVTASKLNLLLAAMTSQKSVAFTICAILLTLFSLRSPDTVLELLKTVTDDEMVGRICKAGATAYYGWNSGPGFEKFVDGMTSDLALRRQMVLDTAIGLYGSDGEVDPNVLEVIGNGSSGRENQQIVMALLRQNDPPKQPFLSNKQQMLTNDVAMEKALRAVSPEDPMLARQWLLRISDSALRGKVAIDLNLQP